MAEEPENYTLRLLREMREETNRRFDKLGAAMSELQVEVSALTVSMRELRADVGEIRDTQKNQGARLNAIDGRLALIEKHTGMVEA